MVTTLSLYQAGFIVSLVGSVTGSFYLIRREGGRGRLSREQTLLIVAFLTLAIASLCDFLIITVPSPLTGDIVGALRAGCITASAMFLFAFTLEYGGFKLWNTRFIQWGFWLLGTSLVTLMFSNAGTYWVWESAVLIDSGPFPYYKPGEATYLSLLYLYSNFTFLVGGFLILTSLLPRPQFNSKAVSMMVASFGAVILLNIWTVFGLFTAYNLTTVFAIIGIAGITTATELDLFNVRTGLVESAVDEVEEGVLIFNYEHQLVKYNNRIETLLPEVSQYVGRDPRNLPEFGEEIWSVLQTLEPGEKQCVHTSMTDQGQNRYFELTVTHVEEGKYQKGYVVSLVEMTRIEEQKRQLEAKNEKLEQVVGALSHDIRNPLMVISGMAEMLEEEVEEEHLEDFAQAITESSSRANQMLNDLVELFGKQEDLDLDEVDFEAVCEDAWGTVSVNDSELVIDSSGTVYADRSKLMTLLENLFKNALDHNSGRGVTITAGIQKGELYIKDDGSGIPEQIVNSLFEYGETTSDSGTGLGLAIVKTVVDAHNWDITAGNTDGGGAVFRVTNVRTEETPTDPAREDSTTYRIPMD